MAQSRRPSSGADFGANRSCARTTRPGRPPASDEVAGRATAAPGALPAKRPVPPEPRPEAQVDSCFGLAYFLPALAFSNCTSNSGDAESAVSGTYRGRAFLDKTKTCGR